MVSLRASPLYRSVRFSRIAVRPAAIRPRQQLRYAHESYGGGEGNPTGENPQQQGANPSAEKEHPGPPPPSVGQGTGGGPTKADGSGHNTADHHSASTSGSKGHAASGGAQPKILNPDAPAEEGEDVKQHNADNAKRHDRADGDQDDQKVDPKYWSGMSSLIIALSLPVEGWGDRD